MVQFLSSSPALIIDSRPVKQPEHHPASDQRTDDAAGGQSHVSLRAQRLDQDLYRIAAGSLVEDGLPVAIPKDEPHAEPGYTPADANHNRPAQRDRRPH